MTNILKLGHDWKLMYKSSNDGSNVYTCNICKKQISKMEGESWEAENCPGDIIGLGNTDVLALKNDADKDPWHLFPWDAARAIVKVLKFGANKYTPRNWEKGFNTDRLFRAAIEHLVAWYHKEDGGKGPGIDPETGFSHLWHAGCCVMFLISHELRGIGEDNRPDARTLLIKIVQNGTTGDKNG